MHCQFSSGQRIPALTASLMSRHVCTGEMAIAFAEAGMTLPPWRHHRSMLSKWLPSRARTLRVVPPVDRSSSKAAGRDGRSDAPPQPVHRRQSPVRPRASQGGPTASGRPAKRVHAPKQPSPAAQQASQTAVPAAPAKPAGNTLRRASLLSKEIQDQRAPPPPPPSKPDFASGSEASLRVNSGSAWSGASSDGGSTHDGASAACPRIRTVKMRGGSSAGGSSGGRMPTSLVLPPVSSTAA